ncbi:BgTH12-00534 [Blumeria graminis f. sp. triticale]|uniref:BgTH12-00534 n=1 Tax=Blumeria graminis f. sp. triticale TaxID=1689686 RepID=A0A9W4DBY6_BLUGR|nr:BgTH12-00534 [Blumeria graminis f. sp. triticale]
MANWKEKGFVPDTDDECEFTQDTQEKVYCKRLINQLQNKPGGFAGAHNDDVERSAPKYVNDQEQLRNLDCKTFSLNHDTTNYEVHASPTLRILELDKKDGFNSCTSSIMGSQKLNELNQLITEANHVAATDQQNLSISGGWSGSKVNLCSTTTDKAREEDYSNSQVSSLSQPTFFKNPEPFWEDDQEIESKINTYSQDISLTDGFSRSYVQITSPASSILSSPPSSMPDFFEYQTTRSSDLNAGVKEALVEENVKAMPESNIFESESVNNFEYPMRRALRHRNPIQLHPYIMEQEKYKQTLRARGVAPIMMFPSQNNRNQKSYQDTLLSNEYEEESQELGTLPLSSNISDGQDWIPISPSCSIRSMVNPKTLSNLSESPKSNITTTNCENSPDLRKTLSGGRYFRRIKKLSNHSTNSSKSERQISPISNTPPDKSLFSASTDIVNNIKTISGEKKPEPAQTPETYPFSESKFTRSPLETFRKPSDGSMLDLEIETNVQTLASNPRSSMDPIMLDSDSDLNLDGPFANVSESVPCDASSDESVQIRKVGKRFRGVLPASHLRLDTFKKSRAPARDSRNFLSKSNLYGQSRKGVAVPKPLNNENSFSASLTQEPLVFTDSTDVSEDEQKQGKINNFIQQTISPVLKPTKFLNYLSCSDESIDDLLPSHVRQSSRNLLHQYKAIGPQSSRYHAKATKGFKRPRENDEGKSVKPSKRHKTGKVVNRQLDMRKCALPKRTKTQKLSILDVPDYSVGETQSTPNFIKIAARTVNLRKDRGRHYPCQKYIRLSTEEDTHDVNSIINDWKEGKIIRKPSQKRPAKFSSKLEDPSGCKNTIQHPKNSVEPEMNGILCKNPREFVFNSRNIQQSMYKFVSVRNVPLLSSFSQPLKFSHRYRSILKNKPIATRISRPAQLESSCFGNSIHNDTVAFKLQKAKLDETWQNLQRWPKNSIKSQVNYFLNRKPSFPAAETDFDLKCLGDISSKQQLPPTCIPRRQKRQPKRLDTSAAKYRQLTSTLIPRFFEREKIAGVSDNKLSGLAKLSTEYPLHFNISPLRQGTHFQNNTFIGSGRLRMTIQPSLKENFSGGTITLRLTERNFSWNTWNETSASEVGICFDILSDWLTECENSRFPSTEVREIAIFVLDYTQQYVSFDGLLGQESFLLRMSQILQEFSSRINLNLQPTMMQLNQFLEVLSISSVLVLDLLQKARVNVEARTLIMELEESLKKIASFCTYTLLLQGLENIQKIYDDTQYYSFRVSGIGNKDYPIQGWVIIMTVLKVACIPRSSFWEVTNSRLQLSEINNVFDAETIEKLWYSMYTLLPLTEVDEIGKVVTGKRYTIPHENWALPKQILKRVFTLYKLNQRQFPGFNKYCRTLLTRCYYLMVDWGWRKSSSIIGSIFDFFASQNLSHLRNEEVYHSPQFLEKLDTMPSLAIEPEDCCFHIFLKIVALEFQNLRQVNDLKSIRNLGARLLPNHDRQYPKEEDIYQRDLASLRNHHDLLCTLFWSMPSDERPSISFVQELVIPDLSHKEACLINLRSWENLTKFIVTTTTDPIEYQPFRDWQSTFFMSMYNQYNEAESEARHQLKEMTENKIDSVVEAHMADIIMKNKRNILVTMCKSIEAMGNIIKVAKCESIIKISLNTDILLKALDSNIYTKDRLQDTLLKEVIQVLTSYMDQVDRIYPVSLTESLNEISTNQESQDSLDIVNWNRLEMISPLESLLGPLRPVLKTVVETKANKESDRILATRLIDCYGRLISIVTENERFQKLFSIDMNTVFESRRRFTSNLDCWSLFIAKLLSYGKSLHDLKFYGFDLGLEWFLALVKLEPISTPETMLTFQLQQKGYYLCNTFELHKLHRTQVIKAIVCEMNNLLVENLTEVKAGLTQKQAQQYFSHILGEGLRFIQNTLETVKVNSDAHIKYLAFARSIVTNIRSYASGFRKIPEFFIHPSVHYWPNDDDPNLYVAGIISYSVRLSQLTKRTSFEFLYYIYNGWMNALVTDHLKEYKRHVHHGMRCKNFTKFMLVEFVPAILKVGFNLSAWILCATFLPAISYRISRILETNGSESLWMFEQLINNLKIILNYTSSLAQRPPQDLRGPHKNHRGILSVVFQFWMQIAPSLCQYMERRPQLVETTTTVIDSFNRFIYSLLQCFTDGKIHQQSKIQEYSIKQGRYTMEFVNFFEREIQDCWQFIEDSKFGIIIKTRSQEMSSELWFESTLGEVLTQEIKTYEVFFENTEDLKIPAIENLLIHELII